MLLASRISQYCKAPTTTQEEIPYTQLQLACAQAIASSPAIIEYVNVLALRAMTELKDMPSIGADPVKVNQDLCTNQGQLKAFLHLLELVDLLPALQQKVQSLTTTGE